ncbi:substrate-binding domain-containing protein [Consotaella salsifontis]|uniref:Monosaccharide ABC transporter substrate-binding protein, CUT2 family n=1 Tax=Consotaella salsifontis TaxID=1365950 RepID=A0A1T4QXP1_9HYPH|nr:substrate-binding domain-containing protein [Consotaella salsifontis]SKA08426.1 monosaccharide ABC transporter substrate-binding protein, CUT2 family [Consotaella salsifontis]
MKSMIVSAVIAAGLLAGVSSSGALAADAVKIGFSNRTLNGAFFNGLTEYMKKTADEAGYEIITTDAAGNMNKQISDVEDMLAQGIDYLVLNPQDPAAGVKIAEMASRKGVPVIDLDSDISLSAPVITRVMANNRENNHLIGEFAVKQFAGKPMNVVVISGNQGNLVGQARRDAFMEGVMEAQLRDYGETNFKVVAQGWGNWDQQGGLKAMEDALVAHGDQINAVYSEMDDMALGAIRALKAAGKLEDVKVYAHDGYKYSLEAIRRGEQQATASNNPKLLSEKTIEIIKKYEDGERTFNNYEYIDPILITKDNVDEHYDEKSIF